MEMKQRIIGIIVLAALAILLVPLIFDSEVALPPPNHLPVANVTNSQPLKNDQKTVAYQAPTIKPAQIQQSSDKTLIHDTKVAVSSDANELEDHDNLGTNDDDAQTSLADDDVLDKSEPNDHPISPKETVVTAKATSNKIKSANDELVKEAALKLAVQKESVDKTAASQKMAVKTHTQINSNQHAMFKLTADKSESLKQDANAAQHSGAWAIQLGSFSEIANANKLANNLKAKGFNAFTERDKSRKNVHRVLVGPAQDRNSAEKTLAQLKSESNIQGIVVRYKR